MYLFSFGVDNLWFLYMKRTEMHIKPGIIYFVRETQSDGSLSNLVKIGLVEGTRDPWERLSEHQTGNPRRLIFDEKQFVETPAVKFVERQLHKEFGKYRVSGEWFDFTDNNLLVTAIDKARGLAKEMAPMTPLLEESIRLNDVLSNGNVLPYDESLLQYFNPLMIVKKKKSLMDALTKEIKVHFKEYVAREGTEAIKDLVVEVIVQPAPIFRDGDFKIDEPDMYLACTISTEGWGKRAGFRLTEKAKDSDLDNEFLDMFSSFQSTFDSSTKSNDLYKLNDLRVELEKAKALLEWDIELNSAHIKVACGNFEGIENICKWKREMVTRTEFSIERLIALDKIKYANYLDPQEPSKQLRMIGYKA